MSKNAWFAVWTAVGLAVGFIAGTQYAQYRMVSAFAGAATAFAEGLASPAAGPKATFSNSSATRSQTPSAVEIESARFEEPKHGYGPPSLIVSAKNSGKSVIASISLSCEVKSPSRSVPWAKCSDLHAEIPGGLEPGESKTVEVYGLSSLSAHRALKEHEDAELIVQVTDSRGP